MSDSNDMKFEMRSTAGYALTISLFRPYLASPSPAK